MHFLFTHKCSSGDSKSHVAYLQFKPIVHSVDREVNKQSHAASQSFANWPTEQPQQPGDDTTPWAVTWCMFSFHAAKPRKETNRLPWGGRSSTWTLKRSGRALNWSFVRVNKHCYCWITLLWFHSAFYISPTYPSGLIKQTKIGNWSVSVLFLSFFFK